MKRVWMRKSDAQLFIYERGLIEFDGLFCLLDFMVPEYDFVDLGPL